MNTKQSDMKVKEMLKNVVVFEEKVYVKFNKLIKITGMSYFNDLTAFDKMLIDEATVRVNAFGGLLLESEFAINVLNECVNGNEMIEHLLEAISCEKDRLSENLLLKSETSVEDINSLFDNKDDDPFCKLKEDVMLPSVTEPFQIVPDIKTFDMSMTSRQIADVAGKMHKDVMKKVKTMIDREDINGRNFALVEYRDAKGQMRPEYNLDFDATMTVITGYDASRRKAVIVRWRELEQGRAKPMCEAVKFEIPKTLSEALRLAADQADIIEKKDSTIVGLIEAKRYHTAQGIGKILVESGVRGNQTIVMSAARDLKIVFLDRCYGNVPNSVAVGKGLVRCTDKGSTPQFTAKGTKTIIDHLSR